MIDAGLACLSQATEIVMIGQGKYIDAATTCASGVTVQDKLTLTPAEAKSFTLTVRLP